MGSLNVFVPGPLTNPLNGSRGHWSKHVRWARTWREATTNYVRLARLQIVVRGPDMVFMPTVPKMITLHAQTARQWDDDNLRAGMKPIRDGLKDARIIHDDGPDSGHTFTYSQAVNRKQRGVRITIALAAPAAGGRGE